MLRTPQDVELLDDAAIAKATEPSRRMPPLWLFLTALGSLPAMVLFVSDYNDLHGAFMGTGHIWGRDFVNVWTGGRLVMEGHADLIYSLREYVAYQQEFVGPIKPHYYSYPPSSFFLAAPFGLLPYFAALTLWLTATLAFFLWAAKPYVKDTPNFPLFFAAVTPAATINIWAGHYGFLVGALWLASFARIEHAPRRAGVFAALLTIKPHLGLLLPPLLLARRAWRTILVAAIGAVAMVVVSGLVFGFDLWLEYLVKMSRFQASLLEDQTSFFLAMMPGTFTSLRYITPSSENAAWIAHIGVSAIALFLYWRAQRRVEGWKDLAFIAATATFLILPYAFNYDMTVVSLGFGLLLFRYWDELPIWQRAVLIGGFLSPQLTFVDKVIVAPMVPVILLVGLYVQVQLCARSNSRAGHLQPAST
jgi:alpha-1,2-mannosyltransferase